MSWLSGKTLLLTREEQDALVWSERFESLGARVMNLPCIVCEPVDDPGAPAALRAALTDADWLVFTSRRGAETAHALLGGPLPARVRVAAVGQATGQAALELFGHVDLVPEVQTGRALAQALAAQLQRDGEPAAARVVVAAADRAEELVEAELAPLGTWVTRLSVYRTLPVGPRRGQRGIIPATVDAVVLASPSAAQGLVNQVEVPEVVRLISIGPTTTRALRALGLKASAEAPTPSIEGLLAILRETLNPTHPPTE